MLFFLSSTALVPLLVAVIKSLREVDSAHSLEGTAHRGGEGRIVQPVEVGAHGVTSSHLGGSGNSSRPEVDMELPFSACPQLL